MKSLFQLVLACILMLSFASCNEKKTESVTGTGTLRLYATDAPFNFDTVSEATITVEKINLRQASGNKITVMEKTIELNLLELRNGLVETLSEIEIPAGEYDEILLVIAGAKVVLKDGREFPLKVPSGSESGLKVFVKPNIVITTDLSTDVLLDFDLSQSFIPTGTSSSITGFNFKPVIRAVTLASAGTVSGQVLNVTDENAIAGATVTVTKGDVIVATTITDETGFFKILGLPEDTYNIKAEAENFGSLTIESVNITKGNEVTTHFILNPVTL